MEGDEEITMLEQGCVCKWAPRNGKTYRVKVCGVATNGVSILGKTMIVEMLTPIDGWPYTHAAAFERDLKPEAA